MPRIGPGGSGTIEAGRAPSPSAAGPRSAAGDSFAGALLGYLAATGSTDFATLKQAMVYGTAVASLTVEAFSTDRLAKAGCREIRARRKELLKLIKA